ncbi:MAG: DUF2207 domain-containing protein [Brevinematales bacterium]|nr:DUF2207 domain-containing protein [Brevinematales bacterium]
MKKILIALFLVFPIIATAQESTDIDYSKPEKILDYQVIITVQTDASILIEENIKVFANNLYINHGIYRDIPLQKQTSSGFMKIYPLTVLEVWRDGETEPFSIDDNMGKKRIYIGDAELILTPGDYQYKILYRIDRALNFGTNYTELYWNAIGQEWAFPIEKSAVTIKFPEGVGQDIFFQEAYTGIYGETNTDVVFTEKDGILKYTLTRILNPGAGITVLIRWKNGIIPHPSSAEAFQAFVTDNKGIFIMLGGILIVFFYYLVTWVLVGRDPKKGSIMTYFDPPENLSPAAMRFIRNMKYDEKILSAALVNMAVKGHISIKEKDDSYTLTRVTDTLAGLSDEEKLISNALFSGSKNIDITSTHHAEFSDAIDKCRKSLKSRFEITYFILNLKIFIPGLIFCVLVLFAGIFADSLNFIAGFLTLWLSLWSVGVFAILKAMVGFWISAFTAVKKKASKFAGAIGFTLFGSVFVFAEVAGFYIFFMFCAASMWIIPLAGFAILLNYVFYRLLRAPTLAGRVVMDKIEGFRMFLDVAEKHRMEVLNPPVKDITTFEKFLPYALAFGIEENWAGYFNDILTASRQGQGGYSPSWYSGSTFSASNIGQFTGSLSSGLSSAFSSASVSPSSGGSGGGGFSGGGGGGGGGGGW